MKGVVYFGKKNFYTHFGKHSFVFSFAIFCQLSSFAHKLITLHALYFCSQETVTEDGKLLEMNGTNTNSMSQYGEGNFSLLQFALFNFRESLTK